LRQRTNFLIADIDRLTPIEAIEIIAEGTATSLEVARNTGLSQYEGVLWMERTKGPLAWIMSTVPYGRERRGFGQQFCRLCLATDEVPYFRRRWRLALSVACTIHRVYLEDACPSCFVPVAFHTNDFGKKLLDLHCPIVQCWSCGVDLRTFEEPSDRKAPENLLAFQGALDALIQAGRSQNLPGTHVAPHLFFEGLHIIVHMLVSNSRGARLRNMLLARSGALSLGVFGGERGQRFEGLRIGDRALILGLCATLFSPWPKAFTLACREAKVTSSYFPVYRRRPVPYWLRRELQWELFDEDYQPAAEERRAAERYLENRGIAPARNTVNRLLGVAANRKGTADRPGPRWNPRGPRKKGKNK